MASQEEIEALYDWLDRFHDLRLGEHADISCAFFDGDFSKTLEQAQADKHAWVLAGIKFEAGQTVLDVGCGWGPMLKAITERGGTAIGWTLSSAQQRYCARRGLHAQVQDWKTADPAEIGKVDGVVSIGALEHFCSEKEFLAGQQEAIYRRFFALCAALLPAGGRLYLHTMVWGRKVPDPRTLRLDASRDSDERILARLRKFYPGSWLPSGKEQLILCARPRFEFLHSSNGRRDYIETLRRWGQGTRSLFTTQKAWPAAAAAVKLVPRYLTNRDFRLQVSSLLHHDQSKCFIREIMSHERMFFERK